MFDKLVHLKANHVQPIHMLKCITLQEAAGKPILSFHRQGGLRCVAVCCQGQQQPGKSCQKSARKSRAATKHMYLCCAVMMRKTRPIMADRIHPPHGNVSLYNGRGAAGSLRQAV